MNNMGSADGSCDSARGMRVSNVAVRRSSMKIRFVLLTGLGAICFGCATPPEQDLAALGAASAKAATASAPTRVGPRASLTGTRLPPLDNDDLGTSYLSGVTGEDYRH